MTTDWTERFQDTEWPLRGRDDVMERCLRFLAPDEREPRSLQLDLLGPSGIGKSLFTKELLCRFAALARDSICLYLNIEARDYASAELEKHLLPLLSHERNATREKPVNVPHEVVPRKLDLAVRRNPDGWVWQYLFEEAETRPVVLAIDNVQFLSDSACGELERVLPAATHGIRLIAVERLASGSAAPTNPITCFPEKRSCERLGPLDPSEACKVVRQILGDDVALETTCRRLYATSRGNPKLVWLQLRLIELKRRYGSALPVTVGDYETTISELPQLERLALWIVTFLKGSLRLDDLFYVLRAIVHPLDYADAKIRQTIDALVLIGLLIVNGTGSDRVRPEHELVEKSVSQTMPEEERLEFRQPTIDALIDRLRYYSSDGQEYGRLLETLVGELQPAEVRGRADYMAYLIGLIEHHRKRENYHTLTRLYERWGEIVSTLPPTTARAFLDAFLKTSRFDNGIAAVAKLRSEGSTLAPDELALAEAKYLVQKFDYAGAIRLLAATAPTTESALLRFNIHLNRCEDDTARAMADTVRQLPRELDEFECAMLRNANHLYDAPTARSVVERACKGFERLGRNLGVASSLNNLAVVDLWAGDLPRARQLLEASLRGLEALGSNEAYQPMTNLATLYALEGRFCEAAQLLSKASSTAMRRQLAMDDVMLSFNTLVLELASGARTVQSAATDAERLHRQSLQETEDYRFQQTLGWFANQLAALTGGAPVPSTFAARFRDNGASGLETFKKAVVEDHLVELVFVLSPHWRY